MKGIILIDVDGDGQYLRAYEDTPDVRAALARWRLPEERRDIAMERFTILVRVEAEDQGAAFRFVEGAIEREIVRKWPDDRIPHHDVNVSTPDGAKSTVF